jgi:nucleoid-associated protein YgaU
MAVSGVDWDALKLFLSDHPDAFSSLERDKFGTRYLVLTANTKPLEAEAETATTKKVEAAEAATEAETATTKKVEAAEAATEAETATTKQVEAAEAATEAKDESSSEEGSDDSGEVEDDSGVEDDDEEVAVFKIEIKDTVHEEALETLRNIAVAAFVGAFTSTLLSYCAC